MYQERLRAFGFILPLQLIVVLDNAPRQDIDFSSDVVVIVVGLLGINYLVGIVNRGAETGDLSHGCFIYVVANYTFGSRFVSLHSFFMMNNLIVIVGHTGLPDQSPVNYILVCKFAVNNIG